MNSSSRSPPLSGEVTATEEVSMRVIMVEAKSSVDNYRWRGSVDNCHWRRDTKAEARGIGTCLVTDTGTIISDACNIIEVEADKSLDCKIF